MQPNDPTEPLPVDEEVVADDAAPVDDVVEEEAEAEAEAAAPEADAFWSMVAEGVGEAPDAPNEALLANLTATTLSKLQPEARALIKQVQAKASQDIAAVRASVKAEQDAIAAEKAKLVEEKKEMFRRQAQVSSFMNDPNVKAMLALAGEDVSTVDAFSPDGARRLAQQAAAKAAADALGPMFQAAEKQQKEMEWSAFVEARPMLRDQKWKTADGKTFYEAFAARVKSGKDWESAHNDVLAARYEQEEAARAKNALAARAESMRKVRRDATSGDPARTPSAPPPEIVKQGGAAVAAWLRAHPKARQRA